MPLGLTSKTVADDGGRAVALAPATVAATVPAIYATPADAAPERARLPIMVAMLRERTFFFMKTQVGKRNYQDCLRPRMVAQQGSVDASEISCVNPMCRLKATCLPSVCIRFDSDPPLPPGQMAGKIGPKMSRALIVSGTATTARLPKATFHPQPSLSYPCMAW